jgi:hypothetical protein
MSVETFCPPVAVQRLIEFIDLAGNFAIKVKIGVSGFLTAEYDLVERDP